MQPHVERVYMSERLGTSHGPDIFYEFVYGRVSLGPGHGGSDVVLIRMVYGQQADDAVPAEIHVKDITEVQERFNDFMDRVRKKLDPSAQPYAPMGVAAPATAAAASPEPAGRYAPDAPRRKPGGPLSQPTPAPFQISMGPKKGSGQVGVGGSTPTPATSPGTRTFPLQGMGAPPGAGFATPEAKSRTPEKSFEIISYNLSSPPSTDAIVRTCDSAAGKLVVVARFDLVRKVEDYLNQASQSGGRAVATSDFVTIVVDRDKRPGGSGQSKMKAAIASGLQRMLGMPKAILWIPPL